MICYDALMKKLILTTAIVLGLMFAGAALAYSRTVHFNCGLNHGAFAVFRINHEGTIGGTARYRSPGGKYIATNLKAVPCVSPSGCLVIATAKGIKGYKLLYIIERSSSEFSVWKKKCL